MRDQKGSRGTCYPSLFTFQNIQKSAGEARNPQQETRTDILANRACSMAPPTHGPLL